MAPRELHRSAFAVGLIGLAGFVDALGVLTLGDLFVSFMSGNSTQFAVKLAQGGFAGAGRAGLVIATFVVGVMAGAVVGRLAGARRPRVEMLAVTAVLFGAGLVHLAGRDVAAALVTTFAMGMQNAVYEGTGGIATVTYVTGVLVKLARRLVDVAFGEPLGDGVLQMLLWTGLVAGAVAGTLAWSALRLDAVWIAVAAAAGLTLASFAMKPAEP